MSNATTASAYRQLIDKYSVSCPPAIGTYVNVVNIENEIKELLA